jgi:hypothetical protein
MKCNLLQFGLAVLSIGSAQGANPDPEKRLRLICLDRKSGQRRWEKVIATGNREAGRNNMDSCTRPEICAVLRSLQLQPHVEHGNAL